MLANRLSGLLLASILVLLAACGKDASIQLTRPEAPKTRRVHFALEATDPGKVGAQLVSDAETVGLEASGQRSMDLLLGKNLEIKIAIEPGFEVKSWDVTPAGNADYTADPPTLKLTNVKDDLQVKVITGKIPAVTPQLKQVKLIIKTQDVSSLSAKVSGQDKPLSFAGAGQKIFTIPTGSDLDIALQLPKATEVTGWEVSGGSYSGLGKSTKAKIEGIQEDITVTASVRMVPEFTFRLRLAGKSYLHDQPGSGSVTWKVFGPGKPIDYDFGIYEMSTDTSLGIESVENDRVKPRQYANGSRVVIRVTTITRSDEEEAARNYLYTIVTMDQDQRVDIDLNRLAELNSSSKDYDAYKILGLKRILGTSKGTK